MAQDQANPDSGATKKPYQKALTSSYYTLLGVHPSASVRDIRQAYWDLSKLYHPDTTSLPAAIATAKFQQLNEAYATLSNPERRTAYDYKIGYSRIAVVQPLPNLSQSATRPRSYQSSSAYLDPTDRPLSPGEVFALFILGLTFIACLVLAITIGITRGEAVLQPVVAKNDTVHEVVQQEAVQPATVVQPATNAPTSTSVPTADITSPLTSDATTSPPPSND